MTNRLFPSAALTGIVIVLGACAPSTSENDIEDISQAEVRSLVLRAEKDPKAVLLIDSRPEGDYAREHIAGATNLQIYELNPDRPRLKRLQGYDDLVVYGNDPGSTTASGLTKKLIELKYTPVRRYKGGLVEWKAGGFPTEASPGTVAPR